MSDEAVGMLAAFVVGVLLLVAVLGLLKPVYRRYVGRTEALKKQDQQTELLREQNKLLKKMLEEKK